MKKVIYIKNGVRYQTVINAIGANAIEQALLRKQIALRQVISIQAL